MNNADMPANPSGLIQKRRRNQNDPGSDFVVMSYSEPKHSGLTKREEIAARFMASMLVSPNDAISDEMYADLAVRAADVLLKKLEESK